jgi:hypothetical protein
LPLPRIRQTTLFEADKKISLRPTLHNGKNKIIYFFIQTEWDFIFSHLPIDAETKNKIIYFFIQTEYFIFAT